MLIGVLIAIYFATRYVTVSYGEDRRIREIFKASTTTQPSTSWCPEQPEGSGVSEKEGTETKKCLTINCQPAIHKGFI